MPADTVEGVCRCFRAGALRRPALVPHGPRSPSHAAPPHARRAPPAVPSCAAPCIPPPSSLRRRSRWRPPAARRGARCFALLLRRTCAEPTLSGALLRWAFHDAFTTDARQGGANESLRFEVGSGANVGLRRAVDAVAKVNQETGVGYAGLFALAGAAAVEFSGEPIIEVELGRKDAAEGDRTGALLRFTARIPELRRRFAARGYDDRDLVALSGAHTLGRAFNGVFPYSGRIATSSINDYFVNPMCFADRRAPGLSTKAGRPDTPHFQLPGDGDLIDEREPLTIVRDFAEDEGKFFAV